MLRMEEGEKASECSSGCQSGWTMYLDQSFDNPASLPLRKTTLSSQQQEEGLEEEEEEDLSMVSDASSGPPHFHEEDDHDHLYYCSSHPCSDDKNGCLCSALSACRNNGSKRRKVDHRPPTSSILDDTASSPFFSFSEASCNAIRNINTTKQQQLSVEDVLEFSYGFSATHYKEKSAFHKHLGYLQSPNPVKTTSVRREDGEKKLW